jgi:hypothetical protein
MVYRRGVNIERVHYLKQKAFSQLRCPLTILHELTKFDAETPFIVTPSYSQDVKKEVRGFPLTS